MLSKGFRRGAGACLALALILALIAGSGGRVEAATGGAVYVLTNTTPANGVAVFSRAADGSLTSRGVVSTGGVGLGVGLESAGAVTLSADHAWLLAVNAGSNDLSLFSVSSSGRLTLSDRVSAGGTTPISVAVFGTLVYVLNTGGNGNISGFTLDPRTGRLTPLANSSRPLSGSGVAPGQIGFTPDGTVLIVTETATNLIDTYVVGADGRTTGPLPQPSAGTTPFGFAFSTRSATLVVSEAAGKAPGAATTSSYQVGADGTLHVLSAAVPDTQTSACWAVVANPTPYVYIANTGSRSISSYRVSASGRLALLNPQAALTGTGNLPGDEGTSRDGRFLYVRNSASGTVGAYAIQADGSLTAVTGAGGLPSSAWGLAAF